MLLEAFIVGKSAKFWILIQKMLELIGMICFFWRVSIFCFPFIKLFTFLPSQSSTHLLYLRQWVGSVACLELLLGNATGYCWNVLSTLNVEMFIEGWDWLSCISELPRVTKSRTISRCSQHYTAQIFSSFLSPKLKWDTDGCHHYYSCAKVSSGQLHMEP